MKKFSTGKYNIIVENVRKLEEVTRIRLSGFSLVAGLCAVAIFFIGIGALLMWLTPLNRKLPGFMSQSNREESLMLMLRVDSLQDAFEMNQRYLANLESVFDTSRQPTDSVNTTGSTANALPLDSLQQASDNEKAFVKNMNEKERFNLSVLSPLAADGLIFSHPADGGIISGEPKKSYTLRVIPPVGIGINAITDGIVVDSHADADGTYTVLIQHPKGFLSKYGKLGQPLVTVGTSVVGGQRLSEAVKGHQRYAEINLWRNGTPLYPSDYINRRGSVSDSNNL